MSLVEEVSKNEDDEQPEKIDEQPEKIGDILERIRIFLGRDRCINFEASEDPPTMGYLRNDPTYEYPI